MIQPGPKLVDVGVLLDLRPNVAVERLAGPSFKHGCGGGLSFGWEPESLTFPSASHVYLISSIGIADSRQ